MVTGLLLADPGYFSRTKAHNLVRPRGRAATGSEPKQTPEGACGGWQEKKCIGRT